MSVAAPQPASVLQSHLSEQRSHLDELRLSSLRRLEELKQKVNQDPYTRLVSPPETATGRSKAALARSQQLRRALDETIAKFQTRREEADVNEGNYERGVNEGRDKLQSQRTKIEEDHQAKQKELFEQAQKNVHDRMQQVREEIRESTSRHGEKGTIAPESFDDPQDEATESAQQSYRTSARDEHEATREEWRKSMATLREQVRHRATLEALEEVRRRYQDRMEKLAVTIQAIKEQQFDSSKGRQRSDSDAQLEARKRELLQRRRAQQQRSAEPGRESIDADELVQATAEARARAIASAPETYEQARNAVYDLYYDDAKSRYEDMAASRMRTQGAKLEDLYVDGHDGEFEVGLENLFVSAVPSAVDLESVAQYKEYLTSRQLADTKKTAENDAKNEVKESTRGTVIAGAEQRYPPSPQRTRAAHSMSQDSTSVAPAADESHAQGRASDSGKDNSNIAAAAAVGVGAGVVATAAVVHANQDEPSREDRAPSGGGGGGRDASGSADGQGGGDDGDVSAVRERQSSAEPVTARDSAQTGADAHAGAQGTPARGDGAASSTATPAKPVENAASVEAAANGTKEPTPNELAILEMRKNIEAQWLQDKLTQGGRFLKHGHKGSPNKRFVWVSADMRQIHWGDVNKKKIHGSFDVSKMIAVTPGQTTAIFKRKSGKPNREEFSFSIVGSERSLDLECTTVTERSEWVNAFRYLMENRL